MKFFCRLIFIFLFVLSAPLINWLITGLLNSRKVSIYRTYKTHTLNWNINDSKKNILDVLPKYQGPGADGKPVSIDDSDEDYRLARNKSIIYGANNFISDMIGLKRIQRDMRPDKCKDLLYPSNLPDISVIIIFREEPVVSLLRTVYSILETSPEKLIREIILVDDGSKTLELMLAVQVHAANVDKLKLIRNENSMGLMMARQKGIENASSEYFIVLDGHIEVTPGWLEPIIYRLVQEPKALLTSHIGILSKESFLFQNLKTAHSDLAFMFFDQVTLDELWVPYSKTFRKIRNGSVLPIEYGIVPGMMMAMQKSYFLSLGGFDPGMQVWGSEHIEISVKVWLCGGRVEMVPCSKIAHLYRNTPWQKFHPNNRYFRKNQVRFALVWMDGFLKELALELKKGDEVNIDEVGDVSERLKIKTENHCLPYQHYIDKIREISDVYIPTYVRLKGTIRNWATNSCLDHAYIDDKLVLLSYSCHGHSNQYFIYTEDFNIRVDRSWLTVESETTNLKVLREETDRGAEFKWKYDKDGHIIHELSGTCLSTRKNGTVQLEKCNSEALHQRWVWSI